MNDPNDTDIMPAFAKLADAIDERRYPGAAWAGPQRSRHVVLKLTAGLSAAAASILIAVGITIYFGRQQVPTGEETTVADNAAVQRNDINTPSTAVATAEQNSTENDVIQNPWSISTTADVATPSVQAGIPSISMPSLSEIQWAIPTSLTTEQTERNTDDKKDDDFDSSLPGGSSICRSVLRNCPDVG